MQDGQNLFPQKRSWVATGRLMTLKTRFPPSFAAENFSSAHVRKYPLFTPKRQEKRSMVYGTAIAECAL
jgi:hypothetical protein